MPRTDSSPTSASSPSTEVSARRPCPQCASPRVYRSHRRGPLERALGVVGLKIRRCHACNVRFARFGGSVILIADLERTLRRLGQLALALAGILVVAVAMLWLMARQAAG